MEASWECVVALDFWTFQDCGDKEIGRKFLDLLQRFEFVPRRFGDEDPPRHTLEVSSSEDLLKLWAKRPGQLIMERLGRMGFQALVHLSNPLPILITFAVHDEYFQREDNIGKFLEFSEDLYELIRPFHCKISHTKDWYNKTVIIKPMKVGGRIVNAESHEPVQPIRGLPGIFWANFLGPPFVDFYSRAKLRAAPAYAKKELFDGGYLILTSKSPLEYMRQETKKMERSLIEYLGTDTVFDKALPHRILRSPFPARANTATTPIPKSAVNDSTTSPSLHDCPGCGESKKIEETGRDSGNNLIGFRCLKCGALWMVHASLF